MDNKVAYVFPGQGSQWVGMGHDLYQSLPEARAVFEEADSVLGFPLSQLCFAGREEILRQTVNAQPAVLAVSIAHLRAMPQLCDEATLPAFVAGHSLGEYTALAAAEVLDFAAALRLARERGHLMQQAGEKNPGGMAAIIGLDEAEVAQICSRCGIEIANFNSPHQIVISGSTELLCQAVELARAAGARRVIPLEVSGAFHSYLMAEAVAGMSEVIGEFAFRDSLIPIVANTIAQPVTSALAIKSELLEQLRHPVQWQRSIEYMIGAGVETFIEVGPGRVLAGLIKQINRGIRAWSISDVNHPTKI